jgi:signal transduction histidine kinase
MKQLIVNALDARQPRTSGFFHDLRQCVATGLLLSHVIDAEDMENEAQVRLATIRRVFEQIRGLVDAEDGEPGPRWTKLDLSKIVDECVRIAHFMPEVTITATLAKGAAAYGDPVLLSRAVTNLLDNAARAAGPAGQVNVLVSETGTGSTVEVSDDGVGFGRAPRGSGQGLAVVAAAVRACRGRLEILSGPGPGTKVRLLLPTCAVAR